MYITSRTPIRQILTSGTIQIDDVKRIIVTQTMRPKNEEPALAGRQIRIETELGLIEIVLRADAEAALKMETEPVSVFATLRKTVKG